MKSHYHVMNGIHGCLPDYNEVYETISDARNGLKENVSMARENGDRLKGNLKNGYFEVITSKTSNYYYDIEECKQKECLEEIEE